MNNKRIFIYTTSNCNHKCKHCYLGYEGSFEPQRLVEIVENLSKEYEVIINGAEPLLNIDYLKSYQAAGQDFIFTNGIIIAESDASVIFEEMHKCGIKKVRVSHHFSSTDILGAVNEKTIEKAIDNLQKNNFCVELNTTITTKNVNDIEGMCEYCVHHGIHRIKFFALIGVGRATTLEKSLFLDDNQVESLYLRITEMRAKYPIELLKIRVDGSIGGFSDKFLCEYGSDGIALTPDGSIFGCPFAVGNREPIGYLDENFEVRIEKLLDWDRKKCFLQNEVE